MLVRINHFNMQFKSIASNVAFARVVVSAFASQLDYTLNDLEEIKVAVSEAVTNSIIHGYKNDFDLKYDVRFSTYAVPMIIGEIKRFLRDDNSIKISRSLKELSQRIQFAKEKLADKLGREPSISEITSYLGCAREEIVMALEASQSLVSLHEALNQDDNNAIFILDQLKVDNGGEEQWIEQVTIKELMLKLSERERQVMLWRFFEDLTQAETAKKLQISQVQVSRLERQAIKKLRKMLLDE